MSYVDLNNFISRDINEKQNLIAKIIGREVSSIEDMLKEIKNHNKRDKKLYEITKDISKIMDMYDEDHKIKINRSKFLEDFTTDIKIYFSKEKIFDYKEVIDLIIHETVSFDDNNWENIYNNIKRSINEDNEDINKNALYSLDFEDLTPKRLISILKKENDDMIAGGNFSFESYTQEMLAIINEFVILKGNTLTNMYLDQGKNEDLKIMELLKEVNAASLVEPFTFNDNNPQFKKAPGGQFDGFILHKNKAKVILATKDENTVIEGDSLFRHFVTGMLIKKKIDAIVPNKNIINKKTKEWINYYTNDERVSEKIKKLKKARRNYKLIKGENLKPQDYYVDKSFAKDLHEIIKDAKERGLKEVSIPIYDNNLMEHKLDPEFAEKELKLPSKDSKTGAIKLNIETAIEKFHLISSIVMSQEKEKNELKDEGYNKVVSNPKFEEQIIIDTKKLQMVRDEGYSSIKEMIAYYNKNTKEALGIIGIVKPEKVSSNLSKLEILSNYEKTKDLLDLPTIEKEDMSMLLKKASDLNVEVIYFGSVSGKKQTSEYHYDNDENKLTNKEFRFGLNILAYANVLSDSTKDKFTITTDAALDFVSNIQLRAVTRKTQSGFDLDLDKINKNQFLKDVILSTIENIFEKNKIKDDSINFYENLFNSTNVLLADFLEDYEVEKEYNPSVTYQDVFSLSMSAKTGVKKDYNLIHVLKTIKEMSLEKSNKFIHGNSIIEVVNNKVDKILLESDDPKMKELFEKYKPKRTDRSKSARRKRLNS